MSEENMGLIARMPLEVFSQSELEVIDEVVSPDFTEHGRTMPGTPPGREGVKFYAEAVRRTFPDPHSMVNRVVAAGDLVVQHITTAGTSAPAVVQATGHPVGVSVSREDYCNE